MSSGRQKTIGILAFACGNEGGVRQYTLSLIEALLKVEGPRYVLFAYPGLEGLERFGIEVRRIVPGSHLLKHLARAGAATIGLRTPLVLPPKERRPFADIDAFVSPIASLYPHFYLCKPYLVVPHDLQECYYPEYFTSKERIFRAVNNRRTVRAATAVISESNYVRNDLVRFLGADPARIHVIPAPPPSQLSEPDEASLARVRERHQLPEHYVFYPAQFWFHKNHLNLLEAFRLEADRDPRLQLVLTGSRQNNYDNVTRRIAELGLTGRVRILGYVDYADLPALYRLSRLLVMPTLFESISIPIYEAFALGVPVCSSNAVALPEQVGDAALLFNPNDPLDIAAKMRHILADETVARELVARGHARVRELTHERYAEKLRPVVEKLLRATS